MLVGALADVFGVDERVEIAELELQRRAHAVAIDHVGASLDDRRSVLDAALVVVGKVENKEIAEVEPPDRLFHFSSSLARRGINHTHCLLPGVAAKVDLYATAGFGGTVRGGNDEHRIDPARERNRRGGRIRSDGFGDVPQFLDEVVRPRLRNSLLDRHPPTGVR